MTGRSGSDVLVVSVISLLSLPRPRRRDIGQVRRLCR
jgi:hypothetical protein